MFDKAKLAALRAKYTGAKETEVAPTEFRKALSLVFGTEYRRSMPYAGLSSLLDMPYRPEAADLPDFGGLDVALVGVPMDLGVTNRAGARFGPRAVREVERIGPYNHALGIAPRGEGRGARSQCLCTPIALAARFGHRGLRSRRTQHCRK